jgi:YfiH family protein
MLRKVQGGIEWLEFELLAQCPEIIHGVFLRKGGVSAGPFTSLNVGDATGDTPEHVAENLQRIRNILHVPTLLSAHQEHGKQIELIGSKPPLAPLTSDGLITAQAGIALMTKHADCQAALFYDPVHRAIGSVHAGWRGNVLNIYAEAIAQMKQHFKTKASDLLVCISPSLGPEHAEFKNYAQEFPEAFWKFEVGDQHFDLWKVARMQLEECGVISEHIEIAEMCTYAHPDELYSYRRDKVTGRNGTVIALRASHQRS